MYIKRYANGWYVVRIPPTKSNHHGKAENKIVRSWFLVKWKSYNSGILLWKHILFPKEFVGKRIRIKIEVLGDH